MWALIHSESNVTLSKGKSEDPEGFLYAGFHLTFSFDNSLCVIKVSVNRAENNSHGDFTKMAYPYKSR